MALQFGLVAMGSARTHGPPPGFELRWIWFLSVASVLVQVALAMWLLRREFARRLVWEAS